MNPVLLNKLRAIEPEIARSYEDIVDQLRYSEERLLATDIDNLVEQLLGAIESAKEDRK